MQEENIQTTTQNTSTATHSFIEVGNDLLSKPDALANIILVRGLPTTLVFCNSPSEADMVDVMLKKKGIQTAKLIGNIPVQKVLQEVQRALNKEICAIVITDVASRELDVKGFELVANYGIPEDPEIYLHRVTGFEQAEQLKEIISLVSPLDFGNFHYLKKVSGLQFVKAELPAADALANIKSKILFQKAQTGEHLNDTDIQALLPTVLESSDRDKIVSLLLYNTLKVLPRLQEDSSARGTSDARYNRNDRRGRGRDSYSNDYSDQYTSDGDSRPRERSERTPRESGRAARERYNNTPIERDARLYLGIGGISADKLNELVAAAGYTADIVKRSTLRDGYTFVDVPEAIADEFIEKVHGSSWPGAADLVLKKATFINVAKETTEQDTSGDDYASDDSLTSDDADAVNE